MGEQELARLWRNRSRSLNQRARMFQAHGHLSGSELRVIVDRDESRCVYCHKALNYQERGENGQGEASFDHVIRLCDGGRHDHTNVVCACRTCNNKKCNEKAGSSVERLRKHLELKPLVRPECAYPRSEDHILPRFRTA